MEAIVENQKKNKIDCKGLELLACYSSVMHLAVRSKM